MHASHATREAEALARNAMDAVAFRVLAHEIRGPNAVISGYARMCREGRLTGTDLADAIQRIEQAAGRLSQIGRQASDLARWLGDVPVDSKSIAVSVLLERAASVSGVPSERVAQSIEGDANTMRLTCLDFEALAGAIAACMTAVARETAEGTLSVLARPVPDAGACDILVGPVGAKAWSEDASPSSADSRGEDPGLDRGGMGLAFILGAVVTLAHGGRIWSAGGRQGLVCLRLPAARG